MNKRVVLGMLLCFTVYLFVHSFTWAQTSSPITEANSTASPSPITPDVTPPNASATSAPEQKAVKTEAEKEANETKEHAAVSTETISINDPDFFHNGKVWFMCGAFLVAMLLLIILPMKFRLVDENLGYFFLLIGLGIMHLAFNIGAVDIQDGGLFIQKWMSDPEKEMLSEDIMIPKLLIFMYFTLSLFALIFSKKITAFISWLTKKIKPELLCALAVFGLASWGSLSVVVIASLGGILFTSLRKATNRNYTVVAIIFSANICVSALVTAIGDPLGTFIVKNLGFKDRIPGIIFMMKTFGITSLLNAAMLSVLAFVFAKRAPQIVASGPETHGHHSSAEELPLTDRISNLLNSTAKLFCFVMGIMLFGVGVKAIAAKFVSLAGPTPMFFVNAISAIADNALLGLLEITPKNIDIAAAATAMSYQQVVLTLGVSLAFWGVGLVPGNVCNVVMKEFVGITFKDWTKTGVPLAIFLALFNFILIKLLPWLLIIEAAKPWK